MILRITMFSETSRTGYTVELPEPITNLDVFKAVFPNIKLEKFGKGGMLIADTSEPNGRFFFDRWAGKPYGSDRNPKYEVPDDKLVEYVRKDFMEK